MEKNYRVIKKIILFLFYSIVKQQPVAKETG